MVHECIIGELYDYDSTRLVIVESLKADIRENAEFEARMNNRKIGVIGGMICYPKPYTLDDYCDRRRTTNLIRFDFCPICGKEIDWKQIKGGKHE